MSASHGRPGVKFCQSAIRLLARDMEMDAAFAQFLDELRQIVALVRARRWRPRGTMRRIIRSFSDRAFVR